MIVHSWPWRTWRYILDSVKFRGTILHERWEGMVFIHWVCLLVACLFTPIVQFSLPAKGEKKRLIHIPVSKTISSDPVIKLTIGRESSFL